MEGIQRKQNIPIHYTTQSTFIETATTYLLYAWRLHQGLPRPHFTNHRVNTRVAHNSTLMPRRRRNHYTSASGRANLQLRTHTATHSHTSPHIYTCHCSRAHSMIVGWSANFIHQRNRRWVPTEQPRKIILLAF